MCDGGITKKFVINDYTERWFILNYNRTAAMWVASSTKQKTPSNENTCALVPYFNSHVKNISCRDKNVIKHVIKYVGVSNRKLSKRMAEHETNIRLQKP